MNIYHIIYQTTNLINGKIYIGKHSTSNLDDGYMGSGTLLKRSILKYGKQNFKTEILFYAFSSKDLFEIEKEIVNREFILLEHVMNIKIGGEGGFDHLNTEEGILARKETFKKWYEAGHQAIQTLLEDPIESERLRKIWRKNMLHASKIAQQNNPQGTFFGKKHTEETKRLIGNNNAIHQSGEKNSQYGTVWINNGIQNKKARKDELSSLLLEGWVKGRNMSL